MSDKVKMFVYDPEVDEIAIEEVCYLLSDLGSGEGTLFERLSSNAELKLNPEYFKNIKDDYDTLVRILNGLMDAVNDAIDKRSPTGEGDDTDGVCAMMQSIEAGVILAQFAISTGDRFTLKPRDFVWAKTIVATIMGHTCGIFKFIAKRDLKPIEISECIGYMTSVEKMRVMYELFCPEQRVAHYLYEFESNMSDWVHKCFLKGDMLDTLEAFMEMFKKYQ